MDAVVVCRKSVKISNICLPKYRSEFDRSINLRKSPTPTKQDKKFVRIERDPCSYFNTVVSRVFRYVSNNGTVLKYTKLSKGKGVDTNNISSLPSSIRKKKSAEKLLILNNIQKKTESIQCSNISSPPHNRRKIVTMLEDDGKIKEKNIYHKARCRIFQKGEKQSQNNCTVGNISDIPVKPNKENRLKEKSCWGKKKATCKKKYTASGRPVDHLMKKVLKKGVIKDDNHIIINNSTASPHTNMFYKKTINHGSMQRNNQKLECLKQKDSKRMEENVYNSNARIQLNTNCKNVNGGKCEKITARKSMIAVGDIHLSLSPCKELPNMVPNEVFNAEKLLTHEKESNNNTIKDTNLVMLPERLQRIDLSLKRINVVEKRNDLQNYTIDESRKTKNLGFTSKNNVTTLNVDYVENVDCDNKKSSPRELIIPPITIKTKECNKFLNLKIDKLKSKNGDSSLGNPDTINNFAETYNKVETYSKQNATCVLDKYESDSRLLDLSLPKCTIASQLQSVQINSDNDMTHKETTLIIERSIVSYSTQNVNIKVVESNKDLDNLYIKQTGARPFNIMTVLRKQLRLGSQVATSESCTSHSEQTLNKQNIGVPKLSPGKIRDINERKNISQDKVLIKPSAIIKKISDTQDILKNTEFSAKFQRELFFLDSFIESIQCLDTSTVEISRTNNTDINKSTIIKREDVMVDEISSDTLSNFSTDDLVKNSSTSICWLNLLIGDDYKRAKDFLFILKLREDALKDFTRSQIIWLEGKKKKDYTNVSVLKKRQRGVLLKLQQECGEMHRIRKILLDITEKKNALLMQSRRNFKEKKFKSPDLRVFLNPDKKFVQRLQREKNKSPRQCSPLKCFNFSGISYTDDSHEFKQIECNTSFRNIFDGNASIKYSAVKKSYESGTQAPYSVDLMKEKCEEKDFMLVDGTYLNILFKKLQLPEIFSHEKEYDVHSAALQGLVDSVNKLFEFNGTTMTCHKNDDITPRTEPIENTSSKNSTPSTARSLVEEFDDFYGSFNETNNSNPKNSKQIIANEENIIEVKTIFETQTYKNNNSSQKTDDKEHKSISEIQNSEEEQNLQISNNAASQTSENYMDQNSIKNAFHNYGVIDSDDSNMTECVQDHSKQDSYEFSDRKNDEDTQMNIADAHEVGETISDLQKVIDTKFKDFSTSSNKSVYSKNYLGNRGTFADDKMDNKELDDVEISRTGDLEDAVSEAEALRLKQLAIELEIKALEQQQSQLTYCIREIPDKPPPPYTPPAPDTISNNGMSITFGMSDTFISEKVIEEHVNQVCCEIDAEHELSINQINKESRSVVENEFDNMCIDFIRDYYKESMNKCKAVKSDCPWDCGNILPLKLPNNQREVRSLITTNICDIFIYNPEEDICKSLQEIQMKRYDYIEEILFAEWKKCEKEWTSLESNEILVKNQLVDGIIIKELDQMLDEYLQLVSQ